MKKGNIVVAIRGIIIVIAVLIYYRITNNFRLEQLQLKVTQMEEQLEEVTQMEEQLEEVAQMEEQLEEVAQMEEQLEDVAQMKEQQTTITRVVSICEDGECRLETMSLTPQGWVDYMRTYPVSGSMISNLELEELFTFTKLDSCWYTDEVKKFLNTEKTHFISYDLLSSEYDGSLYSEDFVMFYLEYRDGIKLLFSNQKDDIEVEMVLKGAKNAKTVNSSPNTYLVFEDCNGYLKAIDENMIIYRLSRKSNTK